MARHRKRHSRHHRHFGDFSPKAILRAHTSVKDAGIGALIGLGGGLGGIYALGKYNAKRAAAGQSAIGFTTNAAGQPVQSWWFNLVPAIGGALLGAALKTVNKRNRAKGNAYFGGAIIGGLVVSGFQFAKAKWPNAFGDYVKVRLAGYGNVLVQQGAMGNMLVTTPVTRAAGPGQFRSTGGYLRTRV